MSEPGWDEGFDEEFEEENDEINFEAEEAEAESETGEEPTEASGDYTIVDDVPVPRQKNRKYPFQKMTIGQSFEVHVDKDAIAELGLTEAFKRQRSSLSSSASSFNRRNTERRMVVRKTGPKTLRCWCVAPK